MLSQEKEILSFLLRYTVKISNACHFMKGLSMWVRFFFSRKFMNETHPHEMKTQLYDS